MAGGAMLSSSRTRTRTRINGLLLLWRAVLWLVVRRRRGSSYDPVAHEHRCSARLALSVRPINEARVGVWALWTRHGIHVGLLLTLIARAGLLLPLVLLLLLLLVKEAVRPITVAIRVRRRLTGTIETG